MAERELSSTRSFWKRKQLREGRRSRYVEVRETDLYTVRADAMEGGLADSVARVLGTGKEADVYLALWKGSPLALKVYRLHRTAQRKGSMIGYAQDRMGALAAKEFTTLQKAYRSGVPVPTPAKRVDNMFTMKFLGDDSFEKAPQLKDVEVEDMCELARQTLGIVEKLARASIVHGDLSEYNIVVDNDRLFAIDFLQSIDLSSRVDRHRQVELAKPLLVRDLENLSHFFAKHDVRIDVAEEYMRLLPLLESEG